MSIEVNDARQQAVYKLEGIKEMMGRLEHADHCHAEEIEDCSGCECGAEDVDLQGMECGEYHDHDAALKAITESPLSVEIRSGWFAPGNLDAAPVEYQILLCTGGPAVRIVGELGNDSEPETARIEYQDWGTPWTEYRGHYSTDKPDVEAVLLSYARQFWYGE